MSRNQFMEEKMASFSCFQVIKKCCPSCSVGGKRRKKKNRTAVLLSIVQAMGYKTSELSLAAPFGL